MKIIPAPIVMLLELIDCWMILHSAEEPHVCFLLFACQERKKEIQLPDALLKLNQANVFRFLGRKKGPRKADETLQEINFFPPHIKESRINNFKEKRLVISLVAEN